jgi:hypothetical protein
MVGTECRTREFDGPARQWLAGREIATGVRQAAEVVMEHGQLPRPEVCVDLRDVERPPVQGLGELELARVLGEHRSVVQQRHPGRIVSRQLALRQCEGLREAGPCLGVAAGLALAIGLGVPVLP